MYLHESVIKSMHVDQSHTPVKGHVRSEFGGLWKHQIIQYAQEQERKKTHKKRECCESARTSKLPVDRVNQYGQGMQAAAQD